MKTKLSPKEFQIIHLSFGTGHINEDYQGFFNCFIFSFSN
ncbi:hypothetical protein RS022_08380 [Candidatus Phytoplasma rubi]|uniref:Uncharacterized protein n=1 Tax=Candidatus Phytoplasma rubi TaxID=399025 RepID=A0ABY7BYB7_9MOLU|nr:hypothetical protein RS022_08380 [Candidatus Phytoplasma rubi]